MLDRQIVVISGKPCTGKSDLADLLAREFGFNVIHSDELLAAHSGKTFGKDNRQELLEYRRELDQETGSKWLLSALEQQINAKAEDTRPIVIDHLHSIEQVLQFRHRFHQDLTHVHLYAEDE